MTQRSSSGEWGCVGSRLSLPLPGPIGLTAASIHLPSQIPARLAIGIKQVDRFLRCCFFSSPPSEQNLPSLFLARWPLRCVGLLSHRSSQRMTTRLPLFDRRLPSRLPPPTTLSLCFWPDTWFLRRACETCEFQRSFFFFVTVSSNRSI